MHTLNVPSPGAWAGADRDNKNALGMAARLEFRKVHGAGNDFILINGPFPGSDRPGLARDLCSRHTGIGADGLVISMQFASGSPAYEVKCMNPDGSEATMCGNALRCAALCAAADHGHAQVSMLMAGVWHCGEVRGSEVA